MKIPPWLIPPFAIYFLLVGLYYFILGIRGARKKLAHRAWLTTEATILQCETTPLREMLRSQPAWERALTLLGLLSFFAEILRPGLAATIQTVFTYEYSIWGQTFVTKESLRHSLNYKPGTQFKCRVNPSQLAQASIAVQEKSYLLHLPIGIALIAISTAMLIIF